jgi:hypothetical protein
MFGDRVDGWLHAWFPFLFQKRLSPNLLTVVGTLVSLLAGILILIVPRLLNYIVALYLIVIGLIGLFGAGNFHF